MKHLRLLVWAWNSAEFGLAMRLMLAVSGLLTGWIYAGLCQIQ